MKIKFGALVVDGRGKIGGHVASKNRGGAYLRTKVTPVNAKTSFQQGVRNLFTSLSQGWRNLTENQRAAWNAAVASFQKTNIFGDLRTPTGLALYQRLNNNLVSIGENQITVPPIPSAVLNVVAESLSATAGTPTLSLVLADDVPADVHMKVFATAPTSAGKSFVKSEFRFILDVQPEATSPVSLLSAYTAKFGGVGAVGQKIFVKVFSVDTTTGLTGSSSQVSCIVEP